MNDEPGAEEILDSFLLVTLPQTGKVTLVGIL